MSGLSEDARNRIQGKLIVASVSGGKDSAAMSLWLTENGVEHLRVFADTGWESEVTYKYLRGPLTDKLGPIREVRAAKQFEEMASDKGMFPSRVRRWCTRSLKVEPIFALLRELADSGHDVVNAVGVRAQESSARARLSEWDDHDGVDAEVWRPLIDWSEEEVIAIHQRHGLAPNPLYLAGARRVGCWPCIYASKEEIRLVADTDPGRVDRIRSLEAEVTRVASERAGEPVVRAMFQARLQQPDGSYPCWPIDKVVGWSRTARGGRQLALFGPPPDDGCMRWGMCESVAS